MGIAEELEPHMLSGEIPNIFYPPTIMSPGYTGAIYMSSQSTSLRSWAIENRVWEPSTWEKFLREYLVPLYKDAWTITIIYSELQQRVSGKELASIEDIDLRERIRAALYGGVEKDPKNSYAKFM